MVASDSRRSGFESNHQHGKGENKEKEAGLALLRTNIIKEAVVVAQWSLLTPEDPGLKPAMSNFQDYMYC